MWSAARPTQSPTALSEVQQPTDDVHAGDRTALTPEQLHGIALMGYYHTRCVTRHPQSPIAASWHNGRLPAPLEAGCDVLRSSSWMTVVDVNELVAEASRLIGCRTRLRFVVSRQLVIYCRMDIEVLEALFDIALRGLTELLALGIQSINCTCTTTIVSVAQSPVNGCTRFVSKLLPRLPAPLYILYGLHFRSGGRRLLRNSYHAILHYTTHMLAVGRPHLAMEKASTIGKTIARVFFAEPPSSMII